MQSKLYSKLHSKLAVQLYTVREQCQDDFPQVLRTLKDMGWSGVQMADYCGYDPAELASLVHELGLHTAGLHVGYPRLTEELNQVVEEAKRFGTRDIICPGVPAELRHEQGYRELKRMLNRAAESVKGEGLRISYHNHAFEFETAVDGQNALEYVLEPAEVNSVLAEIDVYWVKKGGRDIMPFISKYAGRMPIIHLKDMTGDDHADFAEIGEGIIDFHPILQWGEASGVEWYVVEQDRCKGRPMDSVKTSYRNLTRLIAEM